MTTDTVRRARPIPALVQALNPLVRRLLRLGMPMGQNALLTVRGRTSGKPRTFPITLLELDGRRYVFAAFGETNWVRNLRAAGEGTLRRGRQDEPIKAVELSIAEAVPVLESALKPVLRIKGFGSMIGSWYGLTADSAPADYEASARNHAGFELRPAG